MSRCEGWGFLCLIASVVSITLSLSLFSGMYQVGLSLVGVALGILAGGLYAASVEPTPRNAPGHPKTATPENPH